MEIITLIGLFAFADRPVKCYIFEDEGKHIAAVPELSVSLYVDQNNLQESFQRGVKTFSDPLFPKGAAHAMEQIYRHFGYEIPDYI